MDHYEASELAEAAIGSSADGFYSAYVNGVVDSEGDTVAWVITWKDANYSVLASARVDEDGTVTVIQ